MAKFKYLEPADLAEALTLLKTYGDEARVIAGGQSLLILIRQGLMRPQVLISLHRIPQLRKIKFDERQVALGAMATQRQISSDDRIRSALPALAEAASRVGSIHVQNLGTVGGNISHAEPNGDSAPALISLGASVLATSQRGERSIPLDHFFRGPFENVLEAEEMVTRVHVPLPADGASSIYVKHVQRAVDRLYENITVDIAGNHQAQVRVERQDLDEMLGNLVENAAKYGGGRVFVTVEPKGATVDILVEDDGPGIPEERRGELFTRGARLDTTGKPGTGLGLAIVRDVAEIYGGGIRLEESEDLGGLLARLTLPAG